MIMHKTALAIQVIKITMSSISFAFPPMWANPDGLRTFLDPARKLAFPAAGPPIVYPRRVQKYLAQPEHHLIKNRPISAGADDPVLEDVRRK